MPGIVLAKPDTVSSADSSVGRIRGRLTLWYAGTFGIILLLLGLGLFVIVGRQLSAQLDGSLDDATLELASAARSPELSERGDSVLVEAVNGLRIPQRTMYLLDSAAHPISPAVADDWIRAAAISAARHGLVRTRHETTDDRTLRLVARRFRAADGRMLIAGSIADQYELEDKYTDLIGAFSLAAFAAVALVALGGSILTRKSMEPIEETIGNMRRFMADAAHELKTPVAVLRTNAEVVLQKPRDADDYRAALQTVERESNRLGGIVEHMLMLARADAGGRRVEPRQMYLDDIVADSVSAMRPVADAKKVTLNVSQFDEASITGDRGLISELMTILLDNAIKYTRPGGIIDVSVTTDGGHPTIVVSDTGIGIGAADLPRIFDRFYRARDTGYEQEGAGLGLSIAKWIADQHSAEIEVASQTSIGTVVRVLFPPHRQRAHAIEPAPAM